MEQSNAISALDYVVIGLMLSSSAAIGIYYALFSGGRQRSTAEYFLGSRRLGAFPVGISVFISFISAVSFLGTPAETYTYGFAFWLMSLHSVIAGVIITRTFIPKFYRLRLTSIYEYLELRFNKGVRYCAVVISVVSGFLYISFVIYAPSLALSAVTGISMPTSILTIGLICTFYTTIGGIKAVIWTDVLQASIMIIGLIVMLVIGCSRVGGIEEVWRRAEEGERANLFDFRIDPRIRHSFFSIMIGSNFQTVFTLGASQFICQRYLSCASEQKAALAGWIGIALIGAFNFLASLNGIVIYAFYQDCDPVSEGRIYTEDQIVPLYMVDLVGHIPGLSGLMISAVFSASLSTVSSSMNSVAAIAAEDVIKPYFKCENDQKLTFVTKIIAAVCGIVAVCLAFVAPFLGDLLESVLGLVGILNGPILGLFALGLFIPWSSSVGAIIGFIVGGVCGVWVAIGSRLYPLPQDHPPLTCDVQTTDAEDTFGFANSTGFYYTDITNIYTTLIPDYPKQEELPFGVNLYNISYLYYGCFTTVVTMLTGVLASLITGPTDPRTLNPDLFCRLSDAFCCCFPLKCRNACCPSVGSEIKQKTQSMDSLENGFVSTEDFAYDNPAISVSNEETEDTKL